MRQIAAICGILLALALARFWSAFFFPAPLGDELVYDRAFARAEAGGSPYEEPGFLYPPAFARLGAALRAAGGPMAPLYALRALNFGGLLALLGLSARWLPWKMPGRLVATTAVLLLSPAVYQGIVLGNVSFVVSAMVVLSLCLWRSVPALSGGLLGASLVLKPLAPAAGVVLALHRPREGGRRHLWVAGAALATAALAVVVAPGWRVFLERAGSGDVLASSVSPHRLLALAGLASWSPWLTLAVLVVLALFVRRRVLSQDEVLAVAVAGSVAATPLVWNHTLVLTLPLQAMAIGSAIRRWRAERSRSAGWDLALVALAVLALHTAEGATGITDRGAALQALAALPPMLAPVFLLGYVFRRGDYAA